MRGGTYLHEIYPRKSQRKLNGTGLITLITPAKPCAGGLGEAPVPQWGVWGEIPPILVFLD
jgi:hypothetical protein